MKYIETKFTNGEWADEWYENIYFEDDEGEEVTLIFAPPEVVERDEAPEIDIIWGGGLDFSGTREEGAEEYPELKKWILK